MPSESRMQDGLRWLEALAERYEAMARQIREMAAHIRHAEALSTIATAGDGAVAISEAIRQTLGGAARPLKASEIWTALRASRIQLRTRSANPRNLIDPTLADMKRKGYVRRDLDGRWTLAI